LLSRLALLAALGMVLSACGPDYSPNTYATNAVQQANKVDQGVVVGVREVGVSASGTAGALIGGAAGGIAGSQVGTGAGTAFGALGGSLVGGIAGSAAEHVVGDTRAFEYIVRKPNGDLLSVTQKDTDPLSIGQKVLVITGNQARIVPDYTVPVQEAPKQTAAAPKEPPPTTTAPPLTPVQAAPLPAPDQPKVETGP
jgi:outer membrane lipoprotein SlyB